MLRHLEGGRDDERRRPRNTICMMEYRPLAEGGLEAKQMTLVFRAKRGGGKKTEKNLKKKRISAVRFIRSDLHGPD